MTKSNQISKKLCRQLDKLEILADDARNISKHIAEFAGEDIYSNNSDVDNLRSLLFAQCKINKHLLKQSIKINNFYRKNKPDRNFLKVTRMARAVGSNILIEIQLDNGFRFVEPDGEVQRKDIRLGDTLFFYDNGRICVQLDSRPADSKPFYPKGV